MKTDALPGVDPSLCDPVSGVVRTCFELPLEADDPRVFCFVSEASRTSRFRNGMPDSARYGCGVALTRAQAAGAAVGEVVERYCAASCDPRSMRRAPFSALDEEAVDPEAFALFSGSQYSGFRAMEAAGSAHFLPRPFEHDTRAAWVHGFSLTRRRPVLVPAAFVYLPYLYPPDEPFLVDGSSTGLACGRSRDEATLRALCEVVERDAVSIVWHNALALPRIPLAGGELGGLYVERFACRGVRWVLLDATLDLSIPTVLAVLIDERGGTALGSATRPDLAGAARKAMLEAAQVRVACKREMVTGVDRRYADDFHDLVTFPDHARLYTRRAMRRHLEFLWSSGRESPLPPSPGPDDPAADLARCLERLGAAGLDPIALDLTTDDVREAGLWVVRVVVPGMEMLNARHDSPFLGGRRLREVPHALGLRPRPAADHELNAIPHPFP